MSSHGSGSVAIDPQNVTYLNNASQFGQENIGMKLSQRASGRKISSGSIASTGSIILQPLRVRNENTIPSRTVSLKTLDPMNESSEILSQIKRPTRVSHKSSWGTDIEVPPLPGSGSMLCIERDNMENIDIGGNDATDEPANVFNAGGREELSPPGPSIASEQKSLSMRFVAPEKPHTDSGSESKLHPFRRWMSTLNRRKRNQRAYRQQHWSLEYSHQVQENSLPPGTSGHKKSSSWSSTGFVTAVKSASMSLATLSVAPPSRHTRRSNDPRSSNVSNRISRHRNRCSMDDGAGYVQLIDDASEQRAIKRRQTLAELVSSEESYVADLKVLVNVGQPLLYE